MPAVKLLFLAVFISSFGLAVIGISVSYQQFKENKFEAFQTLLYQQIFIFSFFVYSIWGNLALRDIIARVNPGSQTVAMLEFFVPLLGLPFLIISWFMLIKFGFSLNGIKFKKPWTYLYFYGSIPVLLFVLYLYSDRTLDSSYNQDIFLLRLFVVFNIFFHLIFLIPFLKSKSKKKPLPGDNKILKYILVYAIAVAICSVFIWFSGYLGNAGIGLALLFLFLTSALLPVTLKIQAPAGIVKENHTPDTFKSFCDEYKISKREAEIVLEICAGNTNKAISDKLFITLQTVKDHTHRIYTKTHVKSRIQLSNLVSEKAGKNKKK